MNRGIAIAGGAAIVLAAVIGLFFLLRADAEAPAVRSADPAPSTPHHDQKIADRDGKSRIVPIKKGAAEVPAGDRPTIDSHMRDHRAPEHTSDEPPPPPPLPPRPDGRRINVSITSSLSQGFQPVLQECAAAAPPGAATDTARVEGQILVSIRDHQATVTSASLRLNGFSDAAQPAIQQCLQRVVGLTAPASDEADIDAYAITVSMRWP